MFMHFDEQGEYAGVIPQWLLGVTLLGVVEKSVMELHSTAKTPCKRRCWASLQCFQSAACFLNPVMTLPHLSSA